MKVSVAGRSALVSSDEMKIGQIGRLTDNNACNDEYTGHLLRTFNAFVLLENPAHTWSNTGDLGLEVELLPPDTVVMLITEI